VNSVFNSTYTNYVLHLRASATVANAIVQMRMRTVATQEAAAAYNYANGGSWVTAGPTYNWASFSSTSPFAPDTAFWTGIYAGNGYSGSSRIDIFSPNVARVTRIMLQSYNDYDGTRYNVSMSGTGDLQTTTQYTGFRFYPVAGTIAGEYTLYGYRIA